MTVKQIIGGETVLGGVTFPDGMKAVAAWVKSLLDTGFAGKSEAEIAARLAPDGIVPSTVSDDGVKVYYRIVSMLRNAPVRSYSYADPSAYQAAGLLVGDDELLGEILGELIGAGKAPTGKPPAPKSPPDKSGDKSDDKSDAPGWQNYLNVAAQFLPALTQGITEITKKPGDKDKPSKDAPDDAAKVNIPPKPQSFISKEIGPLPVWGWGAVLIAGGGAFYQFYWKKRKLAG